METAIDIIKRLMKEGHITCDEFIVLYDAIKPSNIINIPTPYIPNTTPYPWTTWYTTNQNNNSVTAQ